MDESLRRGGDEKTPLLCRYERTLALVNDDLCFTEIANFEFERIIDTLPVDSDIKYTVDVFYNNPFAIRLFRKVDDLPFFMTRSAIASRRMAVLCGYEILAAYLEDAQDHRRKLQPTPQDSLIMDVLEEQVAAPIEAWSPGLAGRKYFRTIGYLRHLRNSFAHAHDGPSPELASYAAVYSHDLSKFWENGKTDIGGLSFRELPHQELTAEAALGLINLMRVCLREVDRLFAATYREQAIIDAVVADVWRDSPQVRMVPARFSAKVRSAIEDGYGERLPVENIQAAVVDFTNRNAE